MMHAESRSNDVWDHAFDRRGWIGAAILLPMCAVAVFSPPWFRQGTWGDVLIDFAGWLLLGAGLLIRLWSTLYIGGHKSTDLVTDGPYSLCRHPLYVGSFLIVVALAAFLESVSVLAAVLILGIVNAFIVVPSEERHAIECFGDAYRQYAARTPRFLPRTLRMARPGLIQIKVGAFLRELARVLGIVALAAGADLLAFGRAQQWWPMPFGLP